MPNWERSLRDQTGFFPEGPGFRFWLACGTLRAMEWGKSLPARLKGVAYVVCGVIVK